MTLTAAGPAPRRYNRKPFSKGWRPANADAAEQFRELTNIMTSESSPNEIRFRTFCLPLLSPSLLLCSLKGVVVGPLGNPPHVLKARRQLALCSSREDRLHWGRLLYRRRRKWLQWLSRKRFAESAMSLERTDKTSSGRVPWLLDLNGNRSYDVPSWGPDILGPFFSSLYTSSRESSALKRFRLAGLESLARAEQLDGQSNRIELPLFVILEARARMRPSKSAGEDGIVAEMLCELDPPAVDAIRASLEKRLDAVEGFIDPVPELNQILVHCIPKIRSARKVDQLRPISLIAGLAKLYLACLSRVIRLHSAPPKCVLLGFEPGHQPMELTELCRFLFAKFGEWQIPLFTGKSDAHKAFDSIEHPVLDDSLSKQQVPVLLRAAVLCEFVDVVLKVHFQGVSSPPILLGKGRNRVVVTPRDTGITCSTTLCRTPSLSGAIWGGEPTYRTASRPYRTLCGRTICSSSPWTSSLSRPWLRMCAPP